MIYGTVVIISKSLIKIDLEFSDFRLFEKLDRVKFLIQLERKLFFNFSLNEYVFEISRK